MDRFKSIVSFIFLLLMVGVVLTWGTVDITTNKVTINDTEEIWKGCEYIIESTGKGDYSTIPTNLNDYTTYCIRNGSYTSTGIHFGTNTSLIGNGATIIASAANDILFINETENVHISGVYLEGHDTGGLEYDASEDNNCIYLDNTNYSVIENVFFRNCRSAGVYAADNSHYNTITESSFYGSENVSIGVELRLESTFNDITSNDFEKNGYGVVMWDSDYNTISDNDFIYSNISCIYTYNAQGNSITGNDGYYCGHGTENGFGIEISGTSNSTRIIGNGMYFSKGNGLRFQTNSANNTAIGNSFRGTEASAEISNAGSNNQFAFNPGYASNSMADNIDMNDNDILDWDDIRSTENHAGKIYADTNVVIGIDDDNDQTTAVFQLVKHTSTEILKVDEDGNITTAGNIAMTDNDITGIDTLQGTANHGTKLYSDANLDLAIDYDNDQTNALFQVITDTSVVIFDADETGNITLGAGSFQAGIEMTDESNGEHCCVVWSDNVFNCTSGGC